MHDDELFCRALTRLLTYKDYYSEHFTTEDIDRIEDIDALIHICACCGRGVGANRLAVSQAILAKIESRIETLSNDKLLLILNTSLPSEFHALVERTLFQRKIPSEECVELILQAKNFKTVRFFLKRKMRKKTLQEETAIKLLDGRGALRFSVGNDSSKEIDALLSYISSEEALYTIFRSAYDPQLQQAILERMTDDRRLVESVRNGKLHMQARKIALSRIKDEGILVEIAKRLKTGEHRAASEDEKLRMQAVSQLSHRQDLVVEVALQGEHYHTNLDAVAGINDETLLLAIAKQADHAGVRRAAVERMTDQSLLTTLAQKHKVYEDIVLSLAKKLSDKELAQAICVDYLIRQSEYNYKYVKEVFGFVFAQNAFYRLACAARSSDLRREALANITDQSLFASLAKEHSDARVRIWAAERLVHAHLAQEVYLSVAKDNSVNWNLRSSAAERIKNLESREEAYLSVLDHFLEEDRDKSFVILQLADAAPALIKANWGRVMGYAEKHHSDNPNSCHKDVSSGSSDCTHTDSPIGGNPHHRDNGMGKKYLDKFPSHVGLK